MKKQYILKIFVCLLSGFLFCIMITMMYLGGKVNFEEFSSAGNVYDLPQNKLQRSNKTWIYNVQEDGYRIQGDKSLKKFLLDGRQRKWNYLYITIDDMSLPSMQADIVYYNKNQKKIAEQPVVLVPGENIIFLSENKPLYRMGIRAYHANGQLLSLKSIQLREKISAFLPWRIGRTLAFTYGIFLILFGLFQRYKKKNISKRKDWSRTEVDKWMFCLQYAYKLLIEDIAKGIFRRVSENKRSIFRTGLFCLLFLLLALANINGWMFKISSYKNTILVFCMIMLLISTLCTGRSFQPMRWEKPLVLSWLGLWLGTMISDLTAKTSYHFVGYAMFFACGILIYTWNQMRSPSILLFEIMEALEIDFVFAVLYCMVFRTKKLAIQYNGIFRSSEEFSIYSVLMLSVFLTEIDVLLRERKKWIHYLINITGASVSLYFVVRAGNTTGYIAAILVIGIFSFKELFSFKEWRERWKKLFLSCFSGIGIAFFIVCLIHISIKYVPSYLDTEIAYKKETLMTNVPQDMMEAFEALQPGLMQGVVQKDSIEINVYQRAYLRKLSLLGKGQAIRVFNKKVPSYSGYIQMAYRYGIFILVPYITLQICMIGNGIRGIQEETKEKFSGSFWMFLVTIIFICFCIKGNIEQTFGSPLWVCYYLGAGYWFVEKR